MRRRLCRAIASTDLDLSQRCAAQLVEVDVCVVLEPHGLVEGSANVPRMATACDVIGPVAVGCFRAGSTVI